MNELSDFEDALKKKYSCEVEFLHSAEMQKIIDHCGFTHYDIREVCKNKMFLSPKEAVLRDSFSFNNSVLTMKYLMEIDNKKFRYVFCDDEREKPGVVAVPYVFAFPIYLEQSYYNGLYKLEKLKAFL